MAEAAKDIQSYCYARSHKYEAFGKPARSVEISMLPCPGTETAGVNCEEQDYAWRCLKCNEPLLFGFDTYFYCACGRAKADTFFFKCSSENHRDTEFLGPQKPWVLNKFLKDIKTLNILLLGKTGVGKSTWVNSFTNYLAFPSMEAAERGILRFVTSAHLQFTDDKRKRHEIHVTIDEDENPDIGQSKTRNVRGHNFVIGNTWIRFIDTPGILDSRGPVRDRENISKILMYLRNNSIKELHGICFLLNATEQRLTAEFEYGLMELLSHLHKEATKNIVFCFTNSKGSNFVPQEVAGLLEELRKKGDFNMPLSDDIMFCIDNEAFRYLAAKKEKGEAVNTSDATNSSIAISWNRSVDETSKLLNHIKTLQPHVVEETLLLSKARHYMIYITKPLVDVSQLIQENLGRIKAKRLFLENLPEEERKDKLYVDIIYLDVVKLDYPMTVCTEGDCVEYHTIDDCTIEVDFRKACHQQCYLKSVPVDIIGDERLKNCWAFECGKRKDCRDPECGHTWDKHLHVKYKLRRWIGKMELPDGTTVMSSYSEFLEKTMLLVKKLESEQSKIFQVSVKVGKLLEDNAAVHYNNVVGKYIDLLIRQEEMKSKMTGNNDSIERLRAMKQMFMIEEDVQAKAKQAESEELTLEKVPDLLQELYELDKTGKQIEEAFKYSYKLDIPEPEAYDKLHVIRRGHDSFLRSSAPSVEHLPTE